MQFLKKFSFIIVLILIVILGFYFYFIFGNQMRASRAEIKSHDYVEKMYTDYDAIGYNCQGEDTNNDSYVTCNIRVKNKNANATLGAVEKTLILQCPTFWKSFMATSCKEQGIVLNQQ